MAAVLPGSQHGQHFLATRDRRQRRCLTRCSVMVPVGAKLTEPRPKLFALGTLNLPPSVSLVFHRKVLTAAASRSVAIHASPPWITPNRSWRLQWQRQDLHGLSPPAHSS